jgi:serine/threonine protein kinase
MGDILKAVSYMQNLRVMHRDIKAENILLIGVN